MNAGIRELPIYVPLSYNVIVRAPSSQKKRLQRRYKQFLWLCIALGCLALFFGIPSTRVFGGLVIDGVNATKKKQHANNSTSVVEENKNNKTVVAVQQELDYFDKDDDKEEAT